MTPQDAEYLDKVSAVLGLRSRSVLITAIMECLVVDSFSRHAFERLSESFERLFNERGTPPDSGFLAVFRPSPVLEIELQNEKEHL